MSALNQLTDDTVKGHTAKGDTANDDAVKPDTARRHAITREERPEIAEILNTEASMLPATERRSIKLLQTYRNGNNRSSAPNLSLGRLEEDKLAVENLLERAERIMGDHRYVHFSLQDGRAVHLSKVGDGVLVHAVHPGVLPKEVRYTNIADRVFICPQPDNVHTLAVEEGGIERTDVILNDLEIFLYERAQRPLIVQVSPQGYHENDIHKLKLGLQDTGGQDKYINDSAHALTELGYTLLNVNRAGPNHPTNGDVREGMHYSYTGVDLLFVPDAIPESDPRHGTFIPKERMYPSEEWVGSIPPSDPIFFGMARNLATQLQREPQARDFILIGHYADGGTVAWHTARIIEETIKNDQSLSDGGYKTPKVWYNAHSLGVLKQRALEDAGEAYDPNELRFSERNRFEQFLYDRVDGVISTSDTMTHSMNEDFGRTIDYFLPPGVDTNQFHRRPKGVARSDARYDDTWKELCELANQPKEVLNAASLIMEISRTAETKGKIDVLRAFAHSLTDEDLRQDKKFLIINIANPNRPGMQPSERRLAESLQNEIKTLGIARWVITKNDFAPTTVAKLHQMADIFITGAVSEPWGMSLQQAAASQQAIISTTRVPSGTSVLMGEKPTEIDVAGSRHKVIMGDGAIFIEPTDHVAASYAINRLITNREEAASMAQRAFNRVIPSYTWNAMTADFIQDAFGQQIGGDGKVVWPKENALLGKLTKPRWS